MKRKDDNDNAVKLLRRTGKGEETAFRELYDLFNRRIYFYLFRLLRAKEPAEDVMVETFTQIWKGAAGFMEQSRASTWMLGIARNLAMNELRKRRNCDDIDDYPDLSGHDIPDAESADRRAVLTKAISLLSPAHSEVLELVFYHGMNYTEVADITGVPVNTVKTRVYYAKAALRKILTERGIGRDEI